MENIIYKTVQDCVNLEVSRNKFFTCIQYFDNHDDTGGDYSDLRAFGENSYWNGEYFVRPLLDMLLTAINRRGLSACVRIGFHEEWQGQDVLLSPVYLIEGNQYVATEEKEGVIRFESCESKTYSQYYSYNSSSGEYVNR